VETEHPPSLSTVNGPTSNIPSSVSTGVHSTTVPSQSMAADVSSAHRSSQSQSVISVDETVPYSRGVDRSELLSSKPLSSFDTYSADMTLSNCIKRCAILQDCRNLNR